MHKLVIRHLKSKHVDAPLDGLSYILPDETPEKGIFVIDTSLLFGALQGDISEARSLGGACALLKIPTTYLHNAGNDAHVRCSHPANRYGPNISRPSLPF